MIETIKNKLLESVKDKKELSLVIPHNSEHPLSLNELVSKVEKYGKENQIKVHWNVNESKLKLNIYEDSKWWIDLRKNLSRSIDESGSDSDLEEDGEESEDQYEGMEYSKYGGLTNNALPTNDNHNNNNNNSSNNNSSVQVGPMMPPLLITSCDIFIYIHPSKDYVLKLRKHSETHNVFPYIYSDVKELLIDSKTIS